MIARAGTASIRKTFGDLANHLTSWLLPVFSVLEQAHAPVHLIIKYSYVALETFIKRNKVGLCLTL